MDSYFFHPSCYLFRELQYYTVIAYAGVLLQGHIQERNQVSLYMLAVYNETNCEVNFNFGPYVEFFCLRSHQLEVVNTEQDYVEVGWPAVVASD